VSDCYRGKLTSVTLRIAMTAEFTSRFGKERLRFVINEAAQKPVISPGTRSYNVQLALQDLLAAPHSKQYPSGLHLV
jgi:hypothetical protein